MAEILFVQNDSLLKLTGVKDVGDDATISGASVVAELRDGDGNVVSGASQITLSGTSGGSNDYQGTLSSTVALVRDETYEVRLTATSSSGLKGHWRRKAKAKVRYQ